MSTFYSTLATYFLLFFFLSDRLVFIAGVVFLFFLWWFRFEFLERYLTFLWTLRGDVPRLFTNVANNLFFILILIRIRDSVRKVMVICFLCTFVLRIWIIFVSVVSILVIIISWIIGIVIWERICILIVISSLSLVGHAAIIIALVIPLILLYQFI